MAVVSALAAILLPLAVTVVLETGVAFLFGLYGRALAAVVWVNFVTNPPVTLIVAVLAWACVGFIHVRSGGVVAAIPTFWGWFELAMLEVSVVIVEWRLLVWMRGRKQASGRVLVLSVVMNVVSAVLGTFALMQLGVWTHALAGM